MNHRIPPGALFGAAMVLLVGGLLSTVAFWLPALLLLAAGGLLILRGQRADLRRYIALRDGNVAAELIIEPERTPTPSAHTADEDDDPAATTQPVPAATIQQAADDLPVAG